MPALALAALVCLGTAAAASAWALAGARTARPDVYAVAPDTGRTLAVDPPVKPGQKVTVHVSGFAPATAVRVALVGSRTLGSVPADRRGDVPYHYTVPHDVPFGSHALIFSGPAAGASPRHDTGNLLVSVPLDRTWPFRVVGSSGGSSAPASGPPSSSGGSSAGAGHGTRGGGTSATGTDVLGALALGLAALVAGAALVLAARRRPRRG